MRVVTWIFGLLTWWISCSEAARVLMLVPFGGKSQKNVFYGLGKGLADRGHDVTFFNGYKPTTPVKGIREIVPPALQKIFKNGQLFNLFEAHEHGLMSIWGQIKSLFVSAHSALLSSKELDDVMKEDWDIVVMGAFTYSVFYVPYLKEIPFVFLTPVGYVPFLTSHLGNPTLPALTPLPLLQDATDEMDFITRVKNVVGHTVLQLAVQYWVIPHCDSLVAEKFGEGVVPSALEIERNASMIFLPTHPAMDYHQPLAPNTIRVGGIHCFPPAPLTNSILKFLGNSEFVYFSLGSVARPEDMSADQKKQLLQGLGALPYKVLLKWDTDSRAGLPTNIYPSRWFSQQDIIGHPQCRLFITHGGMASFQESVCHGVPMLAMPLTGDHYYNAKRAEKLGVAVLLPWDDLSAASLQDAVTRATQPQLLKEVRQRQSLIGVPQHPRDMAVRWVEQIAKNGGAPHMRSSAVDLGVMRYYSLDVVAFLMAVFTVVSVMMLKMLRCCWSRCCTKKQPGASAQKKRAKRD